MKNVQLMLLSLLLPLGLVSQTNNPLDSTFSQDGIINTKINNRQTVFFQLRVQPDDKSVVFGYQKVNLPYKPIVARYNTDGTLDQSFGTNGLALIPTVEGYGCQGLILSDGKILLFSVDYNKYNIAVTRLLPNGALDTDYGLNGTEHINTGLSIAWISNSFQRPDGRIVLCVKYYEETFPFTEKSCVVQIWPDGILDETFGPGGTVLINPPVNQEARFDVNGAGLQTDGKLLLTGVVGDTVTERRWYMTRLQSNGLIDSTFGNAGVVIKDLGPQYDEQAFDALQLPDGKIIVGGHAQKGQAFHFTMLRLQPDGSTDNSFGLGGKAQISMDCCYSSIYDIILQADGKLLACGYAADDLTYKDIAIARFKANGIVDQTFADGGRLILKMDSIPTSQLSHTLAMQSDQKILVAGFTSLNFAINTGVLLRLYPAGVTGTFSPGSAPALALDAFPNPLSGNTFQLGFQLPEPSAVTLELFDLAGRNVARLLDQAWRPEGEHREEIAWPSALGAGPYFLRIETPTAGGILKMFKIE